MLEGAIKLPVRRAHITVTSSVGITFTADTDTDGHYRVNGLSSGIYALDVVKPGFYVAENSPNGVAVAGLTVQAESGTTSPGDIVVARGASIEGRLLDTNGGPVANKVVQARPLGHENARPATSVQPARSDDHGRYRLHSLPPGNYIVEVAPLSRPAAAVIPQAARAASDASATYYPGVTRLEDAKPVSVPPQQAVVGVDFTFPDYAVSTLSSIGIVEPTPAQPGTSHISGRIARADDGVPIASATVTVIPWDPPFNTGGGRAVTDAQGRYVVAVADGTYRLQVSADGFADRVTYGWTKGAPQGKRIEIVRGRSFEKGDVAMPAPGVVGGRVVDEFGDAAPGVSVRLAKAEYIAGFRRLVPLTTRVAPQPTDDTGAFRIYDLPPDDYYVMAVSGPFASGSDARGFALTLYPGTRSGTDAMAVAVVSGRETLSVDFSVIPAQESDVRGLVVGGSGGPVSGASVALMPASAGDVRILQTSARTQTAADGSFLFRNIPKGSYAIQAQARSPGGPSPTPLFGWTSFELSDATPAVRVEARPPGALRGRVVFDGAAPYPSGPDVSISPVATDLVSTPYEVHPPVTRWADGDAFTLEGPVGRQVMRATVRRQDAWVLTRVMLAGHDVTDAPIDFGRGDVNELEMTFERIGASVSGKVSDGDKPVSDYSVVIFAANPGKLAWPSRFIKLAPPNQQGEFRVTGLLPGEYLAIALPQVFGNQWWDVEFLQTLVGRATPFRLSDNEARTLTLKLMK